MEAIVKHLAEQGIASAAYMAGNELSFESAELFATFHTHMRTYGLATSENWNQFGERTVQRGFDCAMRLFNGPLVQPEAVRDGGVRRVGNPRAGGRAGGRLP